MIRRSAQVWEIGEIVQVGFVRGLKVLAKVPTPGNYLPDQYVLGTAQGRIYRFVPHNGLTRCETLAEAMEAA